MKNDDKKHDVTDCYFKRYFAIQAIPYRKYLTQTHNDEDKCIRMAS